MKRYCTLLLMAILVSCHPREAKNPPPAPTEVAGAVMADTTHNSRNSLTYIGMYKGKLPCADCAGIETTLELAEDFSYVLNRKYLGKNDKIAEAKGSFKWNQAGNGIILSNLEGEPNQFAVGENSLTQLDLQGHKVEGKLGQGYILKKMTETEEIKSDESPTDKLPPKVTGIHWKLAELNGKEVQQIDNKDYFITLKADNSFTAFAGCNSINGRYEFKGSQVKLFRLISTMMACEDMAVENGLKKALESADNYVANEKVLQFRKANVNLAKFEAATAVKK
jgi:heat shock protein HslJ/uncharacterized lipoprotein NlpE involved in copper resistance